MKESSGVLQGSQLSEEAKNLQGRLASHGIRRGFQRSAVIQQMVGLWPPTALQLFFFLRGCAIVFQSPPMFHTRFYSQCDFF